MPEYNSFHGNFTSTFVDVLVGLGLFPRVPVAVAFEDGEMKRFAVGIFEAGYT
jgi:hypothetical protein